MKQVSMLTTSANRCILHRMTTVSLQSMQRLRTPGKDASPLWSLCKTSWKMTWAMRYRLKHSAVPIAMSDGHQCHNKSIANSDICGGCPASQSLSMFHIHMPKASTQTRCCMWTASCPYNITTQISSFTVKQKATGLESAQRHKIQWVKILGCGKICCMSWSKRSIFWSPPVTNLWLKEDGGLESTPAWSKYMITKWSPEIFAEWLPQPWSSWHQSTATEQKLFWCREVRQMCEMAFQDYSCSKAVCIWYCTIWN